MTKHEQGKREIEAFGKRAEALAKSISETQAKIAALDVQLRAWGIIK